MKERETLTEIIKNYEFDATECNFCGKVEIDNCEQCSAEHLANYLLQNGVIAPPCKLNDLFYIIPTDDNGFEEITRVECLGFQISKPEPVADLFRKESGKSSRLYQAGFDMFGKTIFKSREEAEKALKEREKND